MPQLEFWASMSPRQYEALALIAKTAGLLSFVMSVLVTTAILRRKTRLSYHRLFLGIAMADIISSPAYIIGSWAIPAADVLAERYPDQVEDLTNLRWNIGTHASCQTVGFLTQFSSATCFYTASLMAYFYFVLRYRWTESAIRRVERWLHLGPIFVGLTSATAALCLDLYGPVPPICYISKQKGLYWLLFMYIPGWTFFLTATVANLLIYRHVQERERRSHRFGFPQQTTVFQMPEGGELGSDEPPRSRRRLSIGSPTSPCANNSGGGARTQEVLQQCMLFGLANCVHFSGAVVSPSMLKCVLLQNVMYSFCLVPQIQSLEWAFTGGLSFSTSVIAFATLPLFGLPSGLVYFRPIYLALRTRHPEYSGWRLALETVWEQQPAGDVEEATATAATGSGT